MHGDVEGSGGAGWGVGGREVLPGQHALDELDRGEEVGEFEGGEGGQAPVGVEGADEDVPREEGFEVDEAEGVGGCEEDLVGLMHCLVGRC